MASRVGLDHFSIGIAPIRVLRACRKEGIACYDVYKKENKTYFSTRIYERKRVEKLFPSATYLHTSGVLGMLYRNIKKPSRLCIYACVIFMWFTLSSLTFRIDTFGENDVLEKRIQEYAHSYMYKPKEVKQLKQGLLKQFNNEVSWLEVYNKGNVLKIRYTVKEKIDNKTIDNSPLVAQKDALIAYFECKDGFKTKKVNEMVKKGEVLVDNKMNDSFGVSKPLQVSGRVYGYTWQKVTVEMDKNALPDAINYFSLLLKARDEVHIDIQEDEKVEKENVLQFSKNKGKIKLEILYTLLEDITS